MGSSSDLDESRGRFLDLGTGAFPTGPLEVLVA